MGLKRLIDGYFNYLKDLNIFKASFKIFELLLIVRKLINIFVGNAVFFLKYCMNAVLLLLYQYSC